MKKGFFISVEGTDGSGKTTQINNIVKYIEEKGLEVIKTREPGGTFVSEKIRELLLDPENKEIDEIAEAYLYAAARSNHVRRVIKPALKEGKVIISDRYVDSSLVYQGVAREIGIQKVMNMNKLAIDKVLPDLTFFLIVSKEEAKKRQNKMAKEKDRIEQENDDFFQKIYDAYLEIAKMYPERIVIVDASQSIDEVFKTICSHIDKRLKTR